MESSRKKGLELQALELQAFQLEALNRFRHYGYVVVESPRQYGKTVLLKHIIMENQDSQFAYIGLSRQFESEYASLPVTMDYFSNKEARFSKYYDIVIADEVLVNPFEFGNHIKVACAYTRSFITTSWRRNKLPKYLNMDMNQLRMHLGDHDFEVEFGRD